MEQGNAELRENPRQGTGAADRFLHDLRGLRSRAELDHGELAARAHYPRDVITAAEAGPALPELPVLAAYVRGCGGTDDEVADWEDRWRAVTGAAAIPLLPTRTAGAPDVSPSSASPFSASPSSADTIDENLAAGPGAAETAAVADGQDPAPIIAALSRFAERMAGPAPDGGPTSNGRPAPDGRPALAEPEASGPDALRSPAAVPAQNAPARDATPQSGLSPSGGLPGRTLLVAAAIAIALLCLLTLLLVG